MEDQNDSRNEQQALDEAETIFDDAKIVDFLTYTKNEQKISPSLAHSKSQECKLTKKSYFSSFLMLNKINKTIWNPIFIGTSHS